MQTDFIALYRGQTVSEARLVAVTAEPEIVRNFAARLLGEPEEAEAEPVSLELEGARRKTLQPGRGEVEGDR